MAPPHKKTASVNKWFDKAWLANDDISVQYEMEFGADKIRPGTPIKFKNVRGVFKFRCLAHNIQKDVTWIDCVDKEGAWRAFYVDRLKGPVKQKRSRRKKSA